MQSFQVVLGFVTRASLADFLVFLLYFSTGCLRQLNHLTVSSFYHPWYSFVSQYFYFRTIFYYYLQFYSFL